MEEESEKAKEMLVAWEEGCFRIIPASSISGSIAGYSGQAVQPSIKATPIISAWLLPAQMHADVCPDWT